MTLALSGKSRRRQVLLVVLGLLGIAGAVVSGAGRGERTSAAASVMQGYGAVTIDAASAQDADDVPFDLNDAHGQDLWLRFAKGNEVRGRTVVMNPPTGLVFVAPPPSTDVYFRCTGQTLEWRLSSNVVATAFVTISGSINIEFSNTGSNSCEYALVVGKSSSTLIQPVTSWNPSAQGGEITLTGDAGIPTLDSAPIATGVSRITVASSTAPSLTVASCDPNPVIVGQPATCTATVTSNAGSPEGVAQFATDADGVFAPGSCTLVAGTCSVTYTPSSPATSPHTVTATYVPASNHQASSGASQVTVLADSDADGVADGDDVCPGTPLNTPVDGAGCPPRTVRIIKVVEDADGGTPPTASFSGTIVPHGPAAWDIDTSATSTTEVLNVSGSTAQTVVEAAPGAGWAFTGYWLGAGLLDDCAGATFAGTREDGATVPGDGQPYTVCIKNVYTPPPGTIVIRKHVDPEEARNGATFAFDYGALPGGTTPLSHGGSMTFDNVPAGSYTVAETGLPQGWSVSIACDSDRREPWGIDGATVTVDLAPGETVECVFANTHASRTVRIIKVARRSEGGSVPDATFSGRAAPDGPDWSIDTANGTSVEIEDATPYAALTVTESAPGTDWLFGGYDVAAGLLDNCEGADFAGKREDGATVPGDGQPYTVCIENVYAPPVILLAKVVSGALASTSDRFPVTVTQTSGAFSSELTIRAEDGLVPVEVTTGTFIVSEDDPARVGAGYVRTGYSSGTPGSDGSVECSDPAEAPPVVTLTAGEGAVVCIHNRAATLPTVRKDAAGFANGVATWRLTIDNRGPNTIARVVRVTDPGVTLVPADGCTQDAEVISCVVGAEGELVFDVTLDVPGQACAEREIGNVASAVMVTTAGAIDIGSTGEVPVTIPGNPDVCDLPILSKVAGAHSDGHARWTITVDNRVEDAGRRVVVLDDPGTVLVSTDGDCGPAGPGDAVEGITCAVEPGDVVTLVVERAEQPACDPRLAGNAASATVVLEGGGTRALQGSPTIRSFVPVPGEDAECRAHITVRKLFDTDSDGKPGPADTLVNGWGITVTCDREAIPGSLRVTGSDGAGTVVFTVPAPAGGKTCTVSEETVALVRVVGHAVDGGPLEPGASVTVVLAGRDDVSVVFLNDPVELLAPEPAAAVEAIVPGPDPRSGSDSAGGSSEEPQAPGPAPGTPSPRTTAVPKNRRQARRPFRRRSRPRDHQRQRRRRRPRPVLGSQTNAGRVRCSSLWSHLWSSLSFRRTRRWQRGAGIRSAAVR